MPKVITTDRRNYGAENRLYNYGGTLLMDAVRALVEVTDLPTEDTDLNAWLLGPLTISVSCDEIVHGRSARTGNYAAWHRISVPALTAPGPVLLHGHPDLDVDAELVMSALSGRSCGCLNTYNSLLVADRPRSTTPPGPVHEIGMRGTRDDNVAALALACARAWAATDPDLSSEDRTILLDRLVFPDDWQPWQSAGVSLEEARDYLARRIPYEIARPHLTGTAPDLATLRDAMNGVAPLDLASWKALRFSEKTARDWYGRTSLTASEAALLRKAGWTAAQAESAIKAVRASATDPRKVGAVWTVEDLVGWAQADLTRDKNALAIWVLLPEHTARHWAAERIAAGEALALHARSTPQEVREWKRLLTNPVLGRIEEALTTGVTLVQVRQWGGLPKVPALVRAQHHLPLSLLLTVVTTMAAQDWEAWMQQCGSSKDWWANNGAGALGLRRILDAHARGEQPHDVWASVPA